MTRILTALTNCIIAYTCCDTGHITIPKSEEEMGRSFTCFDKAYDGQKIKRMEFFTDIKKYIYLGQQRCSLGD